MKNIKMTNFFRLFVIVFTMLSFSFAKNIEHLKISPKVWSVSKAKQWEKKQKWIVGANFSPSNASNQLDMWQAETWSPELIDKELGYAEKLGMNSIRVYLHYFPFRDDADGFLKRIDNFLNIADKHDIKTIFIFFDDVWNPNPVAGKQPEPKKHVHNSGWVQSPGREILWDYKRHIETKEYVQDILRKFKDDERILFWDLYNEPQNTNGSSYRDFDKEPYSLKLLEEVFEWAREVSPSQPISSGLWIGDWTDFSKLSVFNKFMLENSDIITFHNYNNLASFKNAAEPLLEMGRPIICTEYFCRKNNSSLEEILPYMAEKNIGGINWGLVAGRTQTNYPWDSWSKTYTAEPKLWFHDLLYKDGTPYRKNETDLMKKLTSSINNK